MAVRTTSRKGRWRWLGVVPVLALLLGLLAIAPAKADHTQMESDTDYFIHECNANGGTVSNIDFEDGYI